MEIDVYFYIQDLYTKYNFCIIFEKITHIGPATFHTSTIGDILSGMLHSSSKNFRRSFLCQNFSVHFSILLILNTDMSIFYILYITKSLYTISNSTYKANSTLLVCRQFPDLTHEKHRNPCAPSQVVFNATIIFDFDKQA